LSSSIPSGAFLGAGDQILGAQNKNRALYTIYHTICTRVVQFFLTHHASLIVGLATFFSLTQYHISNGSQIPLNTKERG
jgi:hypothetical protein